MTTLVLTPDRNVRKKDYTGEFKPAAIRLQKLQAAELRPVHIRTIDVSKPPQTRFEQVLARIAEVEQVTCLQRIVFLCHGTKTGLQLGLNRANVARFARALPREPHTITLYACSAAGPSEHPTGDGLFADALRDAVVRQFVLSPAVDVTVDAHTTVDNATRNPYVRRFKRDGAQVAGVGGRWVVEPGSPLWRTWVRALKTDFRFSFPFMSVGEIHDYLAKLK
jgi:hypothetical protein